MAHGTLDEARDLACSYELAWTGATESRIRCPTSFELLSSSSSDNFSRRIRHPPQSILCRLYCTLSLCFSVGVATVCFFRISLCSPLVLLACLPKVSSSRQRPRLLALRRILLR